MDANETMPAAALATDDTATTTRPCAVWSGPMDTLRALLTVAGERDVRFYLNGVCLDTTGPEPVMVATDGCRMLVVRVPLVSTLPRGCYVIPRALLETVKPVKGGRGEGWLPVTLTVYAATDTDTARAELAGASTASAPLVDGRFPDWRRVVPSNLTGIASQFNTDYLADFGTVARLLAGAKRSDGGCFPTFAHAGDIGGRKGDHGAALVTFPRSPDAFGVLMPMRTDSPPTAAPDWAGCFTA